MRNVPFHNTNLTSDHTIGVTPHGEAAGIFLVDSTKQDKNHVVFWVNSPCTLLSGLFLMLMYTARFRIIQFF